jgi:4a-hydroxytetrahydrobiopterin dehydratase
MTGLVDEHCQKDVARLEEGEVRQLLDQLSAWEQTDAGAIARTFRFKDFYETIAFVNALAWIANREDHHPDLEVGYNRCRVHFSTHSVQGLSRNDFICAARVDALI